MIGQQSSKQKKQFVDVNPLESLKGFGSAVTTTAQNETKASMKRFWEQLLGAGEYGNDTPMQGDMNEGQDIFLSKKKQLETQQQEAKPAIRAAYDYAGEILRSGEQINRKESQELQYR